MISARETMKQGDRAERCGGWDLGRLTGCAEQSPGGCGCQVRFPWKKGAGSLKGLGRHSLGRGRSRCKGPVGRENGVNRWGCCVVTKTTQWLCHFLTRWLWVSHSSFPGSTSLSVKWLQQRSLPYRDVGKVEGVTMATLRICGHLIKYSHWPFHLLILHTS